MRSKTRLVASTLALLATTSLADAQSISIIALEGDSVGSIGLLTTVSNIDVNNSGEWLVEVDTDNTDTNADGAIIDANGVVLRENDNAGVAAFPMATIDFFDSVQINDDGDRSHNHFLDFTAGTSDDSGVYFNDGILIRESDVSTAAGFSPGTPYIGFFKTQLNENGQIAVICSVDDPAIATSVDRAIVLLTVDALGALTSETVLFKEGDVLAGQAQAATNFETGPHQFGFNGNGDLLFTARFANAPDRAIYLNNTLLAIEGATEPLTGRLYDNLSGKAVGLNNSGEYAYLVDLDGDIADDELIIKNGNTIIVQEGGTFPDIAPNVIEDFGTGPVLIDDSGNVLWTGEWNVTQDSLFLNQQLLLAEGDSVDGMVVDTIRDITDGYAMSDDGRYIIVRVVFAGSLEAALLIDMQGGFEISCNGDGGDQMGCTDCPCGNNAAQGTIGGCLNSASTSTRLIASGSDSIAAADLRIEASGAPPMNSCQLTSGNALAPANMANPCFGLDSGIQSISLDGLRCSVQAVLRHGVRPSDANGDVGVTTNGWGTPNGFFNFAAFMAGQEKHFQIIHRDDAGAVCQTGQNTSQAVSVTFTM